MEEYRSPIILGSIILYMVICIGVGIWAMRRTQSSRDFFMAGRSLGALVAAVAIFSSGLSGFGFVGGPGLVYTTGLSSLWMAVASSIGYTTGFFLLAKRLRIVAGTHDIVSLPDVVAARYNSEIARLLTAIAIILGVMGYLATQILAMGVVLQSILLASGLSLSLIACIAVSTGVLVFYCVTGGIIASVYTDLIQGLLMAAVGVCVVIAANAALDGGLAGASMELWLDDPESIGPFGTVGGITSLCWYFIFGLGFAGQPHVITKMMMSRTVGDARNMLPIAVIGYAFAAMLWLAIGVAMRALVIQGTHPELTAADLAAPEFLQHYVHPVLAGLVFAGLFAAIMSTADGFLNIGSAAVVHDIPTALRGRGLDRELFWARMATVGLAIVAAGFALYSYYANARLVALLGAFGWSTFAAALVPVVALGLNWKRATARAACAAIILSLVVNFTIELFNITLPFGIQGGMLAILSSMIVFIVVSLLSSQRKLDPVIEEVMDI